MTRPAKPWLTVSASNTQLTVGSNPLFLVWTRRMTTK